MNDTQGVIRGWEGMVCMAYSTLGLATLVSYMEPGKSEKKELIRFFFYLLCSDDYVPYSPSIQLVPSHACMYTTSPQHPTSQDSCHVPM